MPLLFTALLLAGAAGPAVAAPDFRKPREAGPLTVYPDDSRGRRFYYPPGDIAFAKDVEGKPDLRFLSMVYTGTQVSGDRGRIRHRNLLSFGVEMAGPSGADVRAARKALGRGSDLRPLPIRRVEAALVYKTLREPEEKALPPGHFEGDGDSNASSYWTERTYTLRLDNETTQAFWKAMHEGQGVVSIAYAFVSDGIPPGEALDELRGTPDLVKAVKEQLGESEADEPAGADEPGESESKTETVVVKTGTHTLEVDAQRWPDLFQRKVFDGNVPPGYALLDVRCYDFSDGTRPDLYRRVLEIDAEGVSGRRVRLETVFGLREPDLNTRSLRFPFAVRLDRPYRYRITDTTMDGDEIPGEWRDSDSWSRMLDITSKVASLADYRNKIEDEEDETN